MRTMLPVLLLLASCGGSGGGGCHHDAGELVFCQYQDALRIVPGFVRSVDCDGNVTVADDYGLVRSGWGDAEDWTAYHVFGPVDPGVECAPISPALLVGREVFDYSAGAFVLLETEADVDAFLSR